MQSYYYVRFGIHGNIGVFECPAHMAFQRGNRIVCRTDRGVESANILNRMDDEPKSVSGKIIRPFTHNDILLEDRLSRFQASAFEACEKILRDREISTPLIDVEQLHDGENLFFYFLGNVDANLESLVDELAESYGKKIRIKQFAEKLANGCGPDCGTGASQCGTGSCSSCGLSSKCSVAASESSPA